MLVALWLDCFDGAQCSTLSHTETTTESTSTRLPSGTASCAKKPAKTYGRSTQADLEQSSSQKTLRLGASRNWGWFDVPLLGGRVLEAKTMAYRRLAHSVHAVLDDVFANRHFRRPTDSDRQKG